MAVFTPVCESLQNQLFTFSKNQIQDMEGGFLLAEYRN
jgi:hypothetical protein